MTKENKLTRDIIIKTLANTLEPLDYVHAFWEGGAAAFDRIDEWSDIDLYVVVDDKKVNETFLIVEKALISLSPIKQKYDVSHPSSSGLFQAFYRLDDASEYLIVDLAVLKLDSPDKFLEPEIHGNVVFYFNKSIKIEPLSLDKSVFEKKLLERLKRLQARFDMFNDFVLKEINRGNYLEAIDLYYGLTLATLIEALRIRHNPVHHDFKMRYIHYELPPDTIKRLTRLYFVRNEKDLQEKYREASEWFHKMMLKINHKEIGRLISPSKSFADA
jgi:hypothetical protein